MVHPADGYDDHAIHPETGAPAGRVNMHAFELVSGDMVVRNRAGHKILSNHTHLNALEIRYLHTEGVEIVGPDNKPLQL